MTDLFQKAIKIAKYDDVTTPENGLVVYSISYLPTKENRDKAFKYVAENPGTMMMEHTPCGAKLVEIGMASSDSGLSDEEVVLIWKEASKRLINEAKGNVTAFVKGADERSVFRSLELPSILSNPNISTINGEDKYQFASQFSSK